MYATSYISSEQNSGTFIGSAETFSSVGSREIRLGFDVFRLDLLDSGSGLQV